MKERFIDKREYSLIGQDAIGSTQQLKTRLNHYTKRSK